MTTANSSGEQSLADRYGDAPAGRSGWVLGVGMLGAAFVAWVVWAALAHSSPGYGATMHSYDVVSAHEVRVQLDAHRSTDRLLVCTVTAQAKDHSVVGETQVRVPLGPEGDVHVSASVKTDRQATTAVVSACR